MEIRKCTVDELIAVPNFSALLEEYADELAVDGLPHPKAKIEMYKQLEKVGLLHPVAAFLDGFLIGFINVFYGANPHYGKEFAVSESYFVSKDYRSKTSAANDLRKFAEKLSQDLGSTGFTISSPPNGSLVTILPHSGYRLISCSFLKVFNHE